MISRSSLSERLSCDGLRLAHSALTAASDGLASHRVRSTCCTARLSATRLLPGGAVAMAIFSAPASLAMVMICTACSRTTLRSPCRMTLRSGSLLEGGFERGLQVVEGHRLAVQLDAMVGGRGDHDARRLGAAGAGARQVDLGALLRERGAGDHEDDQQHQEDVGERRDVDLGDDVAVAALGFNGTERHGRCFPHAGAGARSARAARRSTRATAPRDCRCAP